MRIENLRRPHNNHNYTRYPRKIYQILLNYVFDFATKERPVRIGEETKPLLIPMKQFVHGNDRNGKFPRMTEAKIKFVFLIGPEMRFLWKDETYDSLLSKKNKDHS